MPVPVPCSQCRHTQFNGSTFPKFSSHFLASARFLLVLTVSLLLAQCQIQLLSAQSSLPGPNFVAHGSVFSQLWAAPVQFPAHQVLSLAPVQFPAPPPPVQFPVAHSSDLCAPSSAFRTTGLGLSTHNSAFSIRLSVFFLDTTSSAFSAYYSVLTQPNFIPHRSRLSTLVLSLAPRDQLLSPLFQLSVPQFSFQRPEFTFQYPVCSFHFSLS